MVIKRKAKLSFLQRNKEESKFFPLNENELGLEHIKSVKKNATVRHEKRKALLGTG